ncbi:hypothetical protein ACFYO0_35890 [Streptomyces sp. NPDC006365]|uniref:hypothetical protein n=1 Tax=Streptomyces sp. NPDC006365 TaxID=3364744 RepID=UPI0036BCFEF5
MAAEDAVLGSTAFWDVARTVLLIGIGLLICARLVALLVRRNARTAMDDLGWAWRAWGGFGLLALATAAWSGFARGRGTVPTWVVISTLSVCGAAIVTALAFELVCLRPPWKKVPECTRLLAPAHVDGRPQSQDAAQPRPDDDLDGGRRKRRTLSTRQLLLLISAGCLALAAGVTVLTIFLPHDGRSGYPALAVGTVLGLYYFGYVGLGKRLRVRLKVVGPDGSKYPPGVAYVAALLETMGRHKPRGLNAPEGADVLQLPSEAISALPATEGKIVAALLSVLQALTSVNPWHAQVVIVDDNTVTVELSRNGRPTDSALMTKANLALGDGRSAQTGGGSPTRPELLTAAAAFLLIRLSERHTVLEEGLCGTSRWRSLACQVLAGTGPYSDHMREQLFATAIEKDRNNNAARLGYFYYRSGTTVGTAKNEKDYVDRLEHFCAHLSKPELASDEGYIALRLRAMLTLINARLNYVLTLSGQTADRRRRGTRHLARPAAARTGNTNIDDQKRWAYAECNDLLDSIDELTGDAVLRQRGTGTLKTPRERRESFAVEMRPMVEIFRAAARGEPPKLARVDAKPSEWYAQACAEVGAESGSYVTALAELEMALGDDALRREAPHDPSLQPLLKARPADLMALIDKQRLSDISAFESHLKQLEKDGVRFTEELLARSEGEANSKTLAESLRVPPSTVQWMREVCQIIDACPDRTQAIPWMNLLVQEGVETCASMVRALNDEAEKSRLEKLACNFDARPLTEEELGKWVRKLSDRRHTRLKRQLQGHARHRGSR